MIPSLATPPAFQGLNATLLDRSHSGARNQSIWKIEVEQGPVIVKLYGRKQTHLRALLRDLGVRMIGKSSVRVRRRQETEGEILELWNREGFDVPRLLLQCLPRLDPQPYLVMEWLDGRTIFEILCDDTVPMHEKAALVRRFTKRWGERHQRALELDEPRLIQLRSGFHHVISTGERLAAFDFEVCYTRRHHVRRLISLEISGYLRTLASAMPDHLGEFLKVIVESYPDRTRLQRVAADVRRGLVPALRWFSRRQIKARAGKYDGKDRVLRELGLALRERPVDHTGTAGGP